MAVANELIAASVLVPPELERTGPDAVKRVRAEGSDPRPPDQIAATVEVGQPCCRIRARSRGCLLERAPRVWAEGEAGGRTANDAEAETDDKNAARRGRRKTAMRKAEPVARDRGEAG